MIPTIIMEINQTLQYIFGDIIFICLMLLSVLEDLLLPTRLAIDVPDFSWIIARNTFVKSASYTLGSRRDPFCEKFYMTVNEILFTKLVSMSSFQRGGTKEVLCDFFKSHDIWGVVIKTPLNKGQRSGK